MKYTKDDFNSLLIKNFDEFKSTRYFIYSNKVDWNSISIFLYQRSQYKKLDKYFVHLVRNFKDKLDWHYISQCKNLSEDFIYGNFMWRNKDNDNIRIKIKPYKFNKKKRILQNNLKNKSNGKYTKQN